MTGSEWMVVLAGAAAIIWVNWYFFLAGGSRGERQGKEGEHGDRGA